MIWFSFSKQLILYAKTVPNKLKQQSKLQHVFIDLSHLKDAAYLKEYIQLRIYPIILHLILLKEVCFNVFIHIIF